MFQLVDHNKDVGDSIEVEDVQAGCSDTGSVTGHTLILQYIITPIIKMQGYGVTRPTEYNQLTEILTD